MAVSIAETVQGNRARLVASCSSVRFSLRRVIANVSLRLNIMRIVRMADALCFVRGAFYSIIPPFWDIREPRKRKFANSVHHMVYELQSIS